MQKLKIAVFYDDRIGHQKQTDGILNALAKIVEIEIAYKKKINTSFVQTFFSYFFSPFVRNTDNSFDLIIGTGSRTHCPMFLFKKKTNAKMITCMKPDFPFLSHMDLAFVPLHDKVKNNENIFKTIGPPNLSVNKNKHLKNNALILVGGIDEKSHYWKSAKIIEKIKKNYK